MKTRIDLLQSLLRLDASVKKTIADLDDYGSDAVDGQALVTLTREQVVSALQRFLSGDVSAEDLYKWADALELREDVDFGEDDDEGAVFGVVSDISTTYVLRGPITMEEAKGYLRELI